MSTSRLRRLLLAPLLVALSVLAAACGGSSADDEAGSAAAGSATTASGAFPARVPDRFGTTTVEAEPKRIAIVGLREQDDVLALGTMPVATTEWFGEDPGALAPWMAPYVKGRPLPEVLESTDGIDIEAVAATNPDLIIGVYSAMTEEEHRTLSRIAPTVGPPSGVPDYGSSWEQELSMVAAAMGRTPQAQQMLGRIQARVRELREENPELAGKSFAAASNYQGIFVYGERDSRSRFFTDLGFSFPPALGEALTDDFGSQLSSERTDLLDVDALLMFAETPAAVRQVERNPILRRLPVLTEGRTIFMREDDPIYAQTSKTSVVTLPILLDQLTPRIVNAIDGDPSTPTTAEAVRGG